MLGLGTFFFFCFAGGFATSRILWMRGRGSGAIAAVVVRPPLPPPQQQLGQLIPFTLISAARLPDKLTRLGEAVLDKLWPINNRTRDSRTIQGLFFFYFFFRKNNNRSRHMLCHRLEYMILRFIKLRGLCMF